MNALLKEKYGVEHACIESLGTLYLSAIYIRILGQLLSPRLQKWYNTHVLYGLYRKRLWTEISYDYKFVACSVVIHSKCL